MGINSSGNHCFSCPVFLLLLMATLCSCSKQEEQTPPKSATPQDSQPIKKPDQATAEKNSYPTYSLSDVAKTAAIKTDRVNSDPLAQYSVEIAADKQINIPGLPGELRVWIGSSRFKADFPERMTQDKTALPAVGESAKVQPFAPAFVIEPSETQCIKIHPSGSEVRFKLLPQKPGTFDVGANVYLFASVDCHGTPIPRTAATLKVMVKVNQKEIFVEKAKQLWTIFWEQLVDFWSALVVLFFGLLLFLIRSRLKQWFGFRKK